MLKINDGLTNYQRWKLKNPKGYSESQKRFAKSEKGKLNQFRKNHSKKGKARQLRYYRTHVGEIVRKKSIAGAAYRYGVSKEEIIRIWKSKCTFCHRDPKKTGVVSQVDHNHKTGEIRGPLCQRCNNFVAYLEHISLKKLAFILAWIGMGVD